MTILYFMIALGLLVAIHEFGHFAVAKLSGIGVEIFSIGFGPKIIGFRKGETDYRVALIPLGGYVKLVGEDPNDTRAASAHPEKAYAYKSVRARLATVLAGPAMNLLLALVLLPLVFWVGKREAVVLQQPAVIQGIMENSPAARVGLQAGDRILKIDDKSIDTWSQAVESILLNPQETVALTLLRNDKPLVLDVTLDLDPYGKAHVGYLGVEPHYVMGNEPLIGRVVPSTPAELAGLKSGDRISAINGQAVSRWTDVLKIVGSSQGRALTVSVVRAGETERVLVTPIPNPGEGSPWVIGIQKAETEQAIAVHRYPLAQAIGRGWTEMKRLTGLTMEILKRLLTLDLSYKSLGGPIQIAAASGQAARSGLGEFLYFMAFLSLQLGILNLLPIPVLDGGHIAFMAVEGIIRREIPAKIKVASQHVGMVLLLGLMLLVTINDINILWGFKHILENISKWF